MKAVDNAGGAGSMVVTLTVMPTLAPHRRTEARIRRIASLVLSITSLVIAIANIVIFALRPSTFLSDGTFGMSPVPAFFVDALVYMPLPALASVLLVGTMSAPAPTSPSVDALPKRLPMIVALVACGLVVVCAVLPVIMIAVSMLFGLIQLAF